MKPVRAALAWAVVSVSASAGCDHVLAPETGKAGSQESARSDKAPGAVEPINYRGTRMIAERVDGRWVIEGDILVADSDLGPEKSYSGHEKGNREFSATGNRKWPNNTIFYRFGDLLATGMCLDASGNPVNCNTRLSQVGYEQSIRAAMNDWEAVSNVRFVEDTGNVQTDYLSIAGTNNECASFMGRIGNSQQFRWSDRCSFFPDGRRRFSTHHELGHAMGLWHEHQRSDRDTYVNVLNNVDTSDSTNYAIGGARVNAYDCDSVMHYAVNLSSKTDTSGNALCPGMGQRDHLSAGDIAAMNVLYPNMSLHLFAFANTGSQELCRLAGREQDANTLHEAWVDGSSVAAPLVSTNLTEGDHTLRCRARSCFWKSGYLYPATTVTAAGNTCGSNGEAFDQTGTLRVANPGLIAVLF